LDPGDDGDRRWVEPRLFAGILSAGQQAERDQSPHQVWVQATSTRQLVN
jgi:hypothetical protein